MNDTKLVLVKFIDGTSKTIEAYYNPQDGYYGYLTKKELFYVSCTSSLKALFPREFVKAISFLDEQEE
jgi:hypothetical protein